MRRRLVTALLCAVVLLSTEVQAQSRVPYGAVVLDEHGNPWVVLDRQRYRLPIYPLDPGAIDAIPAADQWIVPSSRDGWTLGPRPEWASEPLP